MLRWIIAIILSVILCGCVSDDYAPVETGRLQLSTKSGFYRVKPGDTLYSIAWAFNRDYRSLALLNQLAPPYRIEPGQRIRINTTAPQTIKPVPIIQTAKNKHKPYVPPVVIPSHPHQFVWSEPTQPVRYWQWPVHGRVISGFSRMLGGNQGVDISGHYGESVNASAAGVVVYSGAGVRGYGNLIIIKHNNSYLSAYAFNRRILVKDGSRVRAGQKIAEMGRDDSGRVKLHFEIRRNGDPVNPLRYLS
jgi:lipoprotein NlpD